MRAGRLFSIMLVPGAILLLLFSTGLIPRYDSRFYPSGSPAYIPADGDSFQRYIEENRRRIQQALEAHYYSKDPAPFGPAYPLARVVEMRAPFELGPDPQRCSVGDNRSGRGFLLLHGLTDSPYLLTEIARSLAVTYPCARFRSLLLPGHGTVPGDLLNVSLATWQDLVAWGVDSFDGLVSELFLVGYSNGASLAVDYVVSNPEDPTVSGLILLSPGMAAASAGIAIAPYLRHVMRWIARGEDRDPAKYDSLATNAAALFHEITAGLPDTVDGLPGRPVFMAMSGEDTTVDTAFAADLFCNWTAAQRRQLIWYRSAATAAAPEAHCQGINVVDVDPADERFLSHSHVSITMPPENEHYGIDGNYPVCTSYRDDEVLFARCQEDNDTTAYGETSLLDEEGFYEGRLVRRASFNPLYHELIASLTCFVDGDCDRSIF